MTGPNGGFGPINNQQQQPLLQPDQNADTEMQRQPGSQASGQQPIQQRYEPDEPEASNAAERWAVPLPPEILVNSPTSEADTHPALRWQRDSINYA